MDREPREPDMGDDDQEDEVRAYERYIEDPPKDLRIRNREGDNDGRLGIKESLEQDPDRRDRAEEDNRPAEAAAIHIENEPDS
ncbi:hypothetical protein [Nocardia sp. NPDC051750]|uniref:hypothetical protein n=1 Tax=Nocardia sp. NPDC051750 TaxID=3364325 RepID=UPI003788A76E